MDTRLTLGVMVAGTALLASTLAETADAALEPDLGFAEVVDVQRISGQSPLPEDCGDSDGDPIVDSEVEAGLAISPVDPDHLLASWQQDRYASGNGSRSNLTAVSRDGGQTWTDPIIVPGISTCAGGSAHDRATNPWATIGPDGTAYLATLAFDLNADSDQDDAEYVSASLDGGETWSRRPAVLEAGEDYLEKPAVTADPSQPGHAYAVWAVEQQDAVTGQRIDDHMRFARTSDGGATWTAPVTIPPDNPLEWEWPYEIFAETQADGSTSLVVIYVVRHGTTRQGAPGPVTIFSIRSDNAASAAVPGEATWSQPKEIATFTSSAIRGDVEWPSGVNPGIPRAAVGADGAIYVTWSEDTAVGTAPGGSHIRVARSADGGETWATPVTVAGFGHIAFLPTVAVAGDGSVGITWYDVRNDLPGDGELATDVWFASSADGGASWHEVHVAGPFDLRQAPQDAGGTRWFLGDHASLVGSPSGFGALFPMTPPLAEHGASDIFFARIELAQAGPARVTGAGEVPAEDGDSTASFDLSVHSDGEGGLKGHLVIDDPAAGVRIDATAFDSLLFRTSRDGLRCTITGHAEVTRDGTLATEEFSANCLDGGHPATSDRLQIDTESYSGGGRLTSGNVTVHA